MNQNETVYFCSQCLTAFNRWIEDEDEQINICFNCAKEIYKNELEEMEFDENDDDEIMEYLNEYISELNKGE